MQISIKKKDMDLFFKNKTLLLRHGFVFQKYDSSVKEWILLSSNGFFGQEKEVFGQTMEFFAKKLVCLLQKENCQESSWSNKKLCKVEN